MLPLFSLLFYLCIYLDVEGLPAAMNLEAITAGRVSYARQVLGEEPDYRHIPVKTPGSCILEGAKAAHRTFCESDCGMFDL